MTTPRHPMDHTECMHAMPLNKRCLICERNADRMKRQMLNDIAHRDQARRMAAQLEKA